MNETIKLLLSLSLSGISCDEIVIKDLSQIEKQAYGDTLISVYIFKSFF